MHLIVLVDIFTYDGHLVLSCFVKIQVDRNLSKTLFLLLRGHGRDIQSSQKHSLIEKFFAY